MYHIETEFLSFHAEFPIRNRMSRWFISENENVRGPFSSDEVRAMLTDGQISQSTMVWGKPQTSWVDVNKWVSLLPQLSKLQGPIEDSAQQQPWHYAVNGNSVGPLTRAELVNELKTIAEKDQILVWTKGMKAWADLFEFQDLLEEMGLNRREHPRASIHGSAIIRIDDKTLIGQLKTISPGGVGIDQLDSRLAIGEVVSIEIKSDELGDPVNMKAVVQYSTQAGYYGFKAQSLSMEAKSHIISYMKQKLRETDRVAA